MAREVKLLQIHKSGSILDRATHSMYFLATIAILSGLLMFAIGILLQLEINANPNLQHDPYLEVAKLILNNLGSVALVLGVGTVLLEYFGFIDYTKKKLREVVIEDDYISILSPEKKQELKEKLDKELLYPDVTTVERDSLFKVVQDRVVPLLNNYYIKEYIVTVSCSIEGDNIVKDIHKQMLFAHPNIEVESTVTDTPPLDMDLMDIPGIKDENLYTITEFRFKGEDLTKILSPKCDRLIDDTYNVRITYDLTSMLEQLKFKGEAQMDIRSKTIAPLSDSFFIQRVHKPTKNYTIHFHYDSNTCEVIGEGFGFMDGPRNASNRKAQYRTYKNSKVIRFENWILPGDGVVFTIRKK